MTDNEMNPYSAPAESPLPEVAYHESARVRDVMSDAWSMFTEHFVVILLVVAVVWLPLELIRNYVDYNVISPEDFGNSFRLSMIIEGVFGILATAAVISVGMSATSGEVPTCGGALSTALRSWFWFFCTRLLTGLLTGVGLLCLVIPGIYFAIRTAFTDSIVVVEQAAGTTAIRRSFELTQGRFWYTTKLCLIVGVLFILLSTIVSLPIALVAALDHWVLHAMELFVIDVLGAYFVLCFYCGYRALAFLEDQEAFEDSGLE